MQHGETDSPGNAGVRMLFKNELDAWIGRIGHADMGLECKLGGNYAILNNQIQL